MINLELLEEEKPIPLDLQGENGSGTSNYNDLENKPKINGTELKGNLTLEDLGIIVNAVKDILVNGASVVDKDGNANIPMANTSSFGVSKFAGTYAIDNWRNNKIYQNTYALGITELDHALKQAMCDGKGAEWSAEEKANARKRMGAEWRYIGKVETQEDVARMTMALDENGQPFNLRKVRVKAVNYPNASDLTTQIRLVFNNMNESIFHDSTMMTGVKSTETMKVCEVVVEKICNYLFPTSVYTSLNNANASEILVTTTGTSYRHTRNEIDGYINQIDLYSWANVIGKGAYMEVWGVDA